MAPLAEAAIAVGEALREKRRRPTVRGRGAPLRPEEGAPVGRVASIVRLRWPRAVAGNQRRLATSGAVERRRMAPSGPVEAAGGSAVRRGGGAGEQRDCEEKPQRRCRPRAHVGIRTRRSAAAARGPAARAYDDASETWK